MFWGDEICRPSKPPRLQIVLGRPEQTWATGGQSPPTLGGRRRPHRGRRQRGPESQHSGAGEGPLGTCGRTLGSREGAGQQRRRSPQRDKVSSFTPPIAPKSPEPQGPGVRKQGWSWRGRVAPGTVTHTFHSGHRSLQWPPAAPHTGALRTRGWCREGPAVLRGR